MSLETPKNCTDLYVLQSIFWEGQGTHNVCSEYQVVTRFNNHSNVSEVGKFRTQGPDNWQFICPKATVTVGSHSISHPMAKAVEFQAVVPGQEYPTSQILQFLTDGGNPLAERWSSLRVVESFREGHVVQIQHVVVFDDIETAQCLDNAEISSISESGDLQIHVMGRLLVR